MDLYLCPLEQNPEINPGFHIIFPNMYVKKIVLTTAITNEYYNYEKTTKGSAALQNGNIEMAVGRPCVITVKNLAETLHILPSMIHYPFSTCTVDVENGLRT